MCIGGRGFSSRGSKCSGTSQIGHFLVCLTSGPFVPPFSWGRDCNPQTASYWSRIVRFLHHFLMHAISKCILCWEHLFAWQLKCHVKANVSPCVCFRIYFVCHSTGRCTPQANYDGFWTRVLKFFKEPQNLFAMYHIVQISTRAGDAKTIIAVCLTRT